MESNEQSKQNSNRLIDTGNRLTAVRGREVGELGEIGKEIKKKKLMDTDNSVGLPEEKGG